MVDDGDGSTVRTEADHTERSHVIIDATAASSVDAGAPCEHPFSGAGRSRGGGMHHACSARLGITRAISSGHAGTPAWVSHHASTHVITPPPGRHPALCATPIEKQRSASPQPPWTTHIEQSVLTVATARPPLLYLSQLRKPPRWEWCCIVRTVSEVRMRVGTGGN